MKKRLAILLAAMMLMTCVPVMAAAVPAGAADSSKTVSVQAGSGWVKTSTSWMYYVNGKALKKQIATIGGSKYGFDENGKLCLGFFKLWGSTYYASRNQGSKGCGKILTGYRKIGPAFFYLDPAKNGRVTKGFVKIGGKLRYFRMKDGYQRTTKGWFYYGDAMYYVKADGTIATNTTIGGYKIGADGAVRDVYGMDKKAQGYSSNTRYLILVNKGEHARVPLPARPEASGSIIRAPKLMAIRTSAAPQSSIPPGSQQETISTPSCITKAAGTLTHTAPRTPASERAFPTAASVCLLNQPNISTRLHRGTLVSSCTDFC